eukprot:scaffold551330_cov19-Prasinocladus_malaysianus.AAC.1
MYLVERNSLTTPVCKWLRKCIAPDCKHEGARSRSNNIKWGLDYTWPTLLYRERTARPQYQQPPSLCMHANPQI